MESVKKVIVTNLEIEEDYMTRKSLGDCDIIKCVFCFGMTCRAPDVFPCKFRK